MVNPDNKTSILDEVKLSQYVSLIENNPCHIATVSKNNTPNLSVATDIKVLDDTTILISNNEMIHTPDNVMANGNVVLTSFNDKWAGLRLTGKANYYTSGHYFDVCNEFFNNETATPKGVIIIHIIKVEGIA
ncbi:MAG: pyridoxamine 5'-phosphate oxidase family protein [Clostridia bacterium]|nr:pyridoxamine 5'-phosphate oxidase family protein [Clostridia bacterium]